MSFPECNGALHCAAHFCVHGICNITNNCAPIKYKTKISEQIFTSNIILYFKKFIPFILPLGGDTPFYLISRRNQRFLLNGQKNWSPLPTTFIKSYIIKTLIAKRSANKKRTGVSGSDINNIICDDNLMRNG